MNWIKQLFGKPEPVRVKVEPCPICQEYRDAISNCHSLGYFVLEDHVRNNMNSHIASAHYYPKVTK